MFFILLQTTGIALDIGARLEEMLQKVGKGDKKALEELYHETRAAVYGFSLSITKNPSDSEDVLQETYLKVWANAGSYKAKGTPMAWILTITKNLSLMKLREKKRYQDLEEHEWESSFHLDSQVGTIEDRHLLEAALNLLAEEERQIILLHAVSGLKHREIAELLDMALATVLSKYHRGLKKLRKYLEGVDAND